MVVSLEIAKKIMKDHPTQDELGYPASLLRRGFKSLPLARGGW